MWNCTCIVIPGRFASKIMSPCPSHLTLKSGKPIFSCFWGMKGFFSLSSCLLFWLKLRTLYSSNGVEFVGETVLILLMMLLKNPLVKNYYCCPFWKLKCHKWPPWQSWWRWRRRRRRCNSDNCNSSRWSTLFFLIFQYHLFFLFFCGK